MVQILDTKVETKSDLFPVRRSLWLEDMFIHDVIVNTNSGSILGDVKRVPGAGQVFIFRKIPFARTPVGPLRFRKPEPYGSWNGTLNGKAFGPACMQNPAGIPTGFPKDMSEDCLHLNVYVPYELSATSNKSVMVWVHGGSFTAGQSSLYDGIPLSLRGDVIVVTVNYRLGALGFLRIGPTGSPGNFGLWDQHLAFKWVHDNIQAFGGNPNSVTVFGESAGGISVSFQSLYPGNQGLFQRVIAQSGVAMSAGNGKAVQEAEALNISRTLGCQSNDPIAIVECLRRQSAESIISIPAISQPVVDGDFVLDVPEAMLRNKSSSVYNFFSSLDYMVGTLDGDGSAIIGAITPDSVLQLFQTTYDRGLTTEMLCNYLAPTVVQIFFSGKTEISSKICTLYSDSSSLENQSNKIMDFLSDAIFTFPSMLSADLHTGQRSTYAYYMTHVTDMQKYVLPEYTFPWTNHAVHAIDLWYLFFNEVTFYPTNMTQDITLGTEMQLYWTNFAKTG